MSRIVPYELAKLRGFPGKRAIKPGPNPSRPETVPEPPDFLLPTAKREWMRLAPELHRLGLLTVLDIMPFAVYCQSFARWLMAEDEIQLLVVEGSTGNPVQNPMVKIATQAARDVCKFAGEFGMTPCARARVRAGYDVGGLGKFEGLIPNA